MSNRPDLTEVVARVEWAIEAIESGDINTALVVLRDITDDLEPPDRRPMGLSPAEEPVDGRIDREGLKRVADCMAQGLGLQERRAA